MKTVGLREFKNRLGVYIQYVRDGEAVAITDRGRIVAELSPPGRDVLSSLQAMARRGELSLAQRPSQESEKGLYPSLPRVLRKMTAAALLDAERGED